MSLPDTDGTDNLFRKAGNIMYRETLLKYQKDNPWINIAPPAPSERIKTTARDLSTEFPEPLKELLLEMDGDGVFLMNLNLIVRANRLARSLGDPPDARKILIFAKSDLPKQYYGYIAEDEQPTNEITVYKRGIYMLTPERSAEPVAWDITSLVELFHEGKI